MKHVQRHGMKKLGLIALLFALSVPSTATTMFTDFSGSAYDNTSPTQTSGNFRDFNNNSTINAGTDIANTGFSALNFTQTAGAAGAISITLFDTNVTDASPTLFTGSLTESVNFTRSNFNNAVGAGLVALFNEGAGQRGLILIATDNGNTDTLSLVEIDQSGIVNPTAPAGTPPNGTTTHSSTLASVALGTGLSDGNTVGNQFWYNLLLVLSISGDSFTVTGKVFNHSNPANPASAQTTQVGGTLSYTGSLSGLGLNTSGTGEVGLAEKLASATEGISVTDYSFADSIAPEPSTCVLMGTSLAVLVFLRRWAFFQR